MEYMIMLNDQDWQINRILIIGYLEWNKPEKRTEKDNHVNSNQKKAGITILVSVKTDLILSNA